MKNTEHLHNTLGVKYKQEKYLINIKGINTCQGPSGHQDFLIFSHNLYFAT